MGVSKFSEKLAAMKDGFRKAKAQSSIESGETQVPEGVYIGRTTAKLTESKSSGNLMCRRMFVIMDHDEFEGVALWDSIMLEHSDDSVTLRGQRTLHRYLSLCGFDVNDPEEIEDVLEDLSRAKPVVRFRVRYSGSGAGGKPYCNIDVLEKIEKMGAVSSDESEATSENAIRDFLDSRDIAIDDDADLIQLISDNGPYPANKLTEGEKELLNQLGLTSAISHPATVKPHKALRPDTRRR